MFIIYHMKQEGSEHRKEMLNNVWDTIYYIFYIIWYIRFVYIIEYDISSVAGAAQTNALHGTGKWQHLAKTSNARFVPRSVDDDIEYSLPEVKEKQMKNI